MFNKSNFKAGHIVLMDILNVWDFCPNFNICPYIDACCPGRWCWLLIATPRVKSRVTSCEVAIGQVTKLEADFRGFFALPYRS